MSSRPAGARQLSRAMQALDDLLRKLLVVHRLLEAEERLAKREPGRNGRRPAALL